MKKKKAKKEIKKAVPVKSKDIPPQDDEKPFDFGGIPDRDLKKNLGCG
ncbi:MAG TPA: hypothetical protein VG737_10500 [Cyclobacteriaceae bacterium]|nr:hypothetical protein [Cyclobacteriaceae bacterium]